MVRTSTTSDRIDTTTSLALAVAAVVLLSSVPAAATAGAGTERAALAVSIDATNSPVNESETLAVTATVENTGRETVTETVALTVGGEQRDAAEVELGGGENRTVTLSWATGDGDAGSYEATVATANDSDTTDVSVRAPANFSVALGSTTSPVTEGEDLNVTVVVSNVGDLPGNQTVTLSVGTARVDSTDVGLDAGERAEVTLTWATGDGDAGNYSALVSSENDSVRPDVRVNAPSEFSVSIGGTNSPVNESETLEVDATVTNTGDETVTETVSLTVAGEQRDATRVTLGVDESRTVTLTWETGEGDAGTYTANVTVGDGGTAPGARTSVEVREQSANDPPTVQAIRFVPCDPDCDRDPVAVAGGTTKYNNVQMARRASGNITKIVPNTSDSDGAVAGYEWRVDGEVVSDSRTLEYRFDEAREYELALTVTDDEGESATVRVNVTVEGANAPPTVSMNGVQNTTVRNGTLALVANATDPDGNITTYVWTVDGEVVSDTRNLRYTVEEPGDHEVTVRVTDDDGGATTETTTVTVERANEPPEVSVAVSPSSPTVGEPVTITVKASDPDGSVAGYRLDVDGDGEYENRSGEATHTFQDAGEHEVTVLVTDDDGGTTTVNRTIQVSAAGTPTPSEDRTGVGSPGFGPVVALVAIAGAALALRRR